MMKIEKTNQKRRGMKITLFGRIPSKKNSRVTTRSGRTFPSKKYTEWHKGQSLKLKGLGLVENVRIVSILFFMPDNRKADLTNKAESIMDLLVDNDVIKDDSWQHIPNVLLRCEGIDRENPRAEIEIK